MENIVLVSSVVATTAALAFVLGWSIGGVDTARHNVARIRSLEKQLKDAQTQLKVNTVELQNYRRTSAAVTSLGKSVTGVLARIGNR